MVVEIGDNFEGLKKLLDKYEVRINTDIDTFFQEGRQRYGKQLCVCWGSPFSSVGTYANREYFERRNVTEILSLEEALGEPMPKYVIVESNNEYYVAKKGNGGVFKKVGDLVWRDLNMARAEMLTREEMDKK